MPMFKALKLCPNAVVIRGDLNKYAYEGGRIRHMMKELTPIIEPLSIDEAFLDLTGTQRLHGEYPAQSLIKLQRKIFKEIGVTVSVGLSYNKFLAKTASDLDKPHGFAVLGRHDAQDFLKDKSVGFIFGIGPAFERKLVRDGLRDERKVQPRSERKSVSAETTFNADISDIEVLKDKLWQVCLKTADRSKAKNLAGRVVTLKLKTSQFKSITRRRTLAQPVQLADIMFRTLEPLLDAEAKGQKYRLIGAGISGLSTPVGDAWDLLDPNAAKRGRAERATDKAREKFGTDAIVTGRGFRLKKTNSKGTSSAESLPAKIQVEEDHDKEP